MSNKSCVNVLKVLYIDHGAQFGCGMPSLALCMLLQIVKGLVFLPRLVFDL